jgi:ribosome biogenesis GTPase
VAELVRIGWGPFFEAQRAGISRELTIARIAAEHRGRYQLWSERGEKMARRAGRLFYRASREIWDPDARGTPAVGDWVAARWPAAETSLAQVEHIFTRKTAFLRRAAGPTTVPQVVAANIDTVFVVCGLDGDFNVRRIERYLAQLADAGSRGALVLTKADLVEDGDVVAEKLAEDGIEAPIHVVSAPAKLGVDALRAYAGEGQTMAFVGSSGTGKSTLINALVGEDVQKVAAVREYDDRGRHTTRHRQLIPLPDGGLLLDTPGMRELQLWSSEAAIDEAFDDVAALADRCYFRDCDHTDEPECAVVAAIDAGTLSEERLEHYQQLLDEQRERAQRAEEFARRRAKRAKVGARRRSDRKRKG